MVKNHQFSDLPMLVHPLQLQISQITLDLERQTEPSPPEWRGWSWLRSLLLLVAGNLVARCCSQPSSWKFGDFWRFLLGISESPERERERERERELLCLNKIFPDLETGGNLADQPNHKLPGITVIRLSLGITV